MGIAGSQWSVSQTGQAHSTNRQSYAVAVAAAEQRWQETICRGHDISGRTDELQREDGHIFAVYGWDLRGLVGGIARR